MGKLKKIKGNYIEVTRAMDSLPINYARNLSILKYKGDLRKDIKRTSVISFNSTAKKIKHDLLSLDERSIDYLSFSQGDIDGGVFTAFFITASAYFLLYVNNSSGFAEKSEIRAAYVDDDGNCCGISIVYKRDFPIIDNKDAPRLPYVVSVIKNTNLPPMEREVTTFIDPVFLKEATAEHLDEIDASDLPEQLAATTNCKLLNQLLEGLFEQDSISIPAFNKLQKRLLIRRNIDNRDLKIQHIQELQTFVDTHFSNRSTLQNEFKWMTDFFNGIQRQFKVDVDFFEESNYAQHYDDILEKIRVIIEEYLPTDATSILGSLSSLVTKQNNELSKRLNHSYTSDKYSIYTIRSENFQKLVQLVKDTTDYDDQLKIPVTFQDFSDHTFYRDSLNRLIDSLAPELQDNPIVIKNRLLERVFSPELDEFLRVALWFQIQKFDELNWTIDKESADELLNLASNNADELRNRLKNHLEELQSLISFSNELVNDKNNFLQASLLSLQDKMICELTNPTAQSVEWAQEPFSSLIRNQLSSAIGNKIEELSLSEWETAINLKLTDEEQPRVNQTDSNPPKSSESSPGFFKRHRYAILALAIIGLVITAGVLMASGVMAPLGLTFLVGLILGTTLSALGLLSGGIALFKMARDELVHRDDARRQKEPQDLPNPIVPQHENEFELTRAQRFAQHQYEYEKQFHADYAPFYQQVMARAYDIEDKQDPVLSSSKPIPQASGSNGISISGSGFSFYDHTHDKERGAETSIPSSVLNKTSGLGPTNSHFI